MTNGYCIGFPYVADRFGGSTASSLVLARALQQAGHRVHVLTHGAGGRVTEEAQAFGLAVTHLPWLSPEPGYARPDSFRWHQLQAFRAARAAIGNLKLDIVHTNDLTTLRSWAASCFAGRAALVAHWRSNYRESWSIKAALRVASGVIAVSRYSFDRLPEWVRRKGVVEFNSFDPPMQQAARVQAKAAIRTQLGLPGDAALVGIFGHHIVRKRTHMLADVLQAVAHTAAGRPVFGLACGGRAEPYDHELDGKIAAFDLSKRLLRPGFVRPVEDWMAACDVLMAPAIDEPLARNVLEAQALDVPVIVSTDGGLRELIRNGENGLLCNPYDTPGWIVAVRRVLDDAALGARLAQGGRATVAQLTPDRHAARVADVYRGLFSRMGRAA
ncbi:MAG TPA: glycosyltransferase family 4 protein [Rhizomicrobium sp.]|nr:glycosyltransferase family 4 protein [Rhizomicrobium sp.]